MSGIIESNAGRSSGVVAAAGSITKSTSEPAADTNPSGGVGTLWLRTSTGEMYCCTDASTDDNVWTNIGEGTGQQPPISAATGGTVTTDGDYKVHTFNSSSNFVVTTSDADVEYLVIAGGGAGCAGHGSGGSGAGGGAGGYRTAGSFSISNQTYSIVVGAGASGSSSGTHGADGSD